MVAPPALALHPVEVPEEGSRVAVRPTFEELYAAQFDFAWRLARRLGVGPPATDDVLQDAFLVAYRRLDRLDPEASARAWIASIVVNVIRDHRRSFRRRGESVELPEALASDRGDPHDALERTEAVAMLDQVLHRMNDDRREVFVLAECEQLTAPQIASALEIPVNTVYSRCRLAREEFNAIVARLARRAP